MSKLQPAFIQAYAYYEPGTEKIYIQRYGTIEPLIALTTDFMTTISYNPPATISASLGECKAPGELDELADEESSSSEQNESLTAPTLKTTPEEGKPE